jgi:methyltransferase family protein
MTEAEARYCGAEGAAYWQRNKRRLDQEGPARAEAIRELVPFRYHGTPWLEIGAGRGHNLYSYDVGLDCDARQLRYLRQQQRIPILGHATNLSMFPDDTFAVVFTVGVLMHLPSCPLATQEMEHTADESCDTWHQAVQEMARVSSRYVILGEYWADVETPLTGQNWNGCLWARPYTIPGMVLDHYEQPVLPFDTDVRFLIFIKYP